MVSNMVCVIPSPLYLSPPCFSARGPAVDSFLPSRSRAREPNKKAGNVRAQSHGQQCTIGALPTAESGKRNPDTRRLQQDAYGISGACLGFRQWPSVTAKQRRTRAIVL